MILDYNTFLVKVNNEKAVPVFCDDRLLGKDIHPAVFFGDVDGDIIELLEGVTARPTIVPGGKK